MTPQADETQDPPHQVRLDRPRRLSADERALLERPIEPLAYPELHEQAATAEVVATCSCGCPSISLLAAGPRLPIEAMREMETFGDEDAATVTAWADALDGHLVELTLHVRDGRIHELEIWPGWDGGEVQIALPSADTLRHDG